MENLIRLAKDAWGREKLMDLPYIGTWPPPEVLEPFGAGWGKWRRESYSQLPDDMGAHILRGAIYTFIEGSAE